MARIRITVRPAGVGRRFAEAPKRELQREIQDLLGRAGAAGTNEMKRRVTGGGQSKARLNVRSGRLRKSISFKVSAVKQVGNVLELGIIREPRGVPLVYAAIHEYGGVITPKRAKYLTVPLPAILSKAAHRSPKYTARELFAGASGRPVAIIVSKNGNRLIVQIQKKKRRVIDDRTGKVRKVNEILPLYVLKKKVRIPARPYIRPGIEVAARMIGNELAVAVERAISTGLKDG